MSIASFSRRVLLLALAVAPLSMSVASADPNEHHNDHRAMAMDAILRSTRGYLTPNVFLVRDDGKRIDLLSISIDAKQDTPSRLQAYAKQSGAGAQWLFGTGRARQASPVKIA